jgi:hypothetical protein
VDAAAGLRHRLNVRAEEGVVAAIVVVRP